MLSGSRVAASLSGGESPGADSLNKTIDSLKELLLPHWSEEKEKRAERAKELLKREVAGGTLKVKVVGKDKKQKSRRS